MLAEEFIARLERQGLLEEKVIAELRKQVADSRFAITPEAVAKLLVDNGHLTTFQARKLVGELMADSESPTEPALKSAGKATASASKAAKRAPEQSPDEELGLLPFEGDGRPAAAPDPPAPAPAQPKSSSKPSKGFRKPEPAAKAPGKPQAPLEEIVELDAAAEVPSTAAAGGLMPLDAQAGGLMPLDAMSAPAGGLSPFDLGAPGGMMGDLSAMGPAGGIGAPPQAPPPPPAMKKYRARTFNTSPLIILGVPGLVLIVFAGYFLVQWMLSGKAAVLLDLAEQDYKAEAYGNAIKKYDKYLHDYPSDAKETVSYAKVRRGLARMRLATQGAKDMRLAYDTAVEVLPDIETEERFGESRDEVAAILPTIAAGFAIQAKTIGVGPRAVEVVKFADDAMVLVNNASYIPTSLRQSMQKTLDEINKNINLAKRTILQDDKLREAVTEITQLAALGKTIEAFAVRHKLLQDFPGLESRSELRAVVLGVAAKERDLVKTMDDLRDSLAEDVSSPIKVLRCVLSHRETVPGRSVESAEDQVAFVLAKGAVYGFDGITGQVLWRRFVGHETLSHPIPINKLAGADALVVDARQNEVLRLEARTGRVVWRLPIGEKFFNPAVLDSRALVSTVSGRVLEVDVESGKTRRSVQVPLPFSTGAGASSRWPNVYQTGTHSNLYVIDANTLVCKEVFYLGHKAGSVTVPPVMSLNLLFVVENAGPERSLLHVMAADESGLSLKRTVEPFRLNGQVNVPLLQFKNRVIALTNLGEVKVFEVAQSETEATTVKLAATQVATTKAPQSVYGLVDGSTLFTAGERVAGYDIQTTREALNRKWAQNEQETFIAPLQKLGNALLHVRRRRGSPGVTVAAVLLEGGTEVWHTDLAVPITHLSGDVPRKQINAITEHGDLFRVNAAAQKAGILDAPAESAEVKGSAIAYAYQNPSPLADGRIVTANFRDPLETLLFDPSRDSSALTRLKLDTGNQKPGLPPVAFGNSLLVPLEAGQIVLMSPENGKSVSLPFQPKLAPGAIVKWLPLAFTGSDRRELAISDGGRKLYRIGVKDQPQTHLAPLAEVDLNAEFVRPLVAAGDTVYGVQHGDRADVVQTFALPNLTAGKEVELQGRVILGPWQVGDMAILVSDKDGLVCLESGQKQRWATPLTHGPLCGPPLLDGNTLWMTSTIGHVWRVAADTGTEIGGVVLKDPLSMAPVLYGPTLVTATSDGALVMMRVADVGSAETETAQAK